MENVKRLLEEELVDEIQNLNKMDLGSDEYRTTVDGISKLMDKVNDAEKIKLDAQEKEASRIQDAELEMVKIKEEKKGRLTNVLTTVAGIVIPVAVTIWGTITTLKFEEEGTITTTSGKSFATNLFSKK
jgi:hypothetical protein